MFPEKTGNVCVNPDLTLLDAVSKSHFDQTVRFFALHELRLWKRHFLHLGSHSSNAFMRHLYEAHVVERFHQEWVPRLVQLDRLRRHQWGERPWTLNFEFVVEHPNEDRQVLHAVSV